MSDVKKWRGKTDYITSADEVLNFEYEPFHLVLWRPYAHDAIWVECPRGQKEVVQ